MESIAVRKVQELDAHARKWITHLFGRELKEDEVVTFMVFPPHEAPPEADRRLSAARMDAILDKAAANMQDVSDSDFEEAVDEAMDHVRRYES